MPTGSLVLQYIADFHSECGTNIQTFIPFLRLLNFRDKTVIIFIKIVEKQRLRGGFVVALLCRERYSLAFLRMFLFAASFLFKSEGDAGHRIGRLSQIDDSLGCFSVCPSQLPSNFKQQHIHTPRFLFSFCHHILSHYK
jgi:hypothetical protein